MSIRELIKRKLVNDLARELVRTLDLPETDIPHLLDKPAIKDKIELEAESYLERLHKIIIIEDIKSDLKKMEDQINSIKIEIKEDLELVNRLITSLNIDSKMVDLKSDSISAGFDQFYIKELIGKNQTEEAIYLILEFCKKSSKEKYNEVVVHHSKLRKLTTDCRIGKISRNEEYLERNKINDDLLSLLDEVVVFKKS